MRHAFPLISSVCALVAVGCGGGDGSREASGSGGGATSSGTSNTATTGSAAGGGSSVGSGGSSSSTSSGPGGGSADALDFAVIGDFGEDGTDEKRVADLVKSWNVDFVITVGDNNYPDGEASTIDANIGKYYADFIGNYSGQFGAGSQQNRFWPSPGNHDWHDPDLAPYRDYFTLPGNERYYDADLGLVHLFAVDSMDEEPDGNSATSTQGSWLQGALAASTSCFDVVYFHYPPYSSGVEHGSTEELRWPFEAWGADVVMAGHEHDYERLEADGLPYFVNGLGGAEKYQFGTPLPESKVRYNDDYGAMRVMATKSGITYEFWSAAGDKIDELTVQKSCAP